MFLKAKPIWVDGKEREMNVHAVFRAEVKSSEQVQLHIGGTAFFRIYADDTFIAFGPARTAKGYIREEIYTLPKGTKEVLIEAVGYYCKSISTVWQPSYIVAELQYQDEVLAYTGRDFNAFEPGCKVQRTERYSVQRHFTEIWDYRNCKLLTDEIYQVPIMILDETPCVLDRRVPYPEYRDINLPTASSFGTLEYDEERPYKPVRYSWATVPKMWGIFDWEEIPYHPYTWIQRHNQTIFQRDVSLPLTINKGEYVVFDFQRIEAGFVRADIESLLESDVVIGYTEFYEGEEFVFQNMNVHNVVEFFLPEGDRRKVQSFEPYTYRFAILAVKEGSIRLNGFGVKTYMLGTEHVRSIQTDDKVLNDIYQAAIRNYAHNEVDLYMDCPSRERAGWIGDSYFTARGEYALTGDTKTEDAFLENYLLYENQGEFPKGAIPECYPADAPPQGDFIPQFTMLFILEVDEYIRQRGHLDRKEAFREKIYGLLDFYRRYENEDGLLECLPSWNFVEWGKANDWIQDVSYPTNFLYSKVLECIGHLYDDDECLRRCEEVRKTAIEQSFNGQYFMDHAVRDTDGKLVLQKEVSEVGQYYAVLFGNIDIHSETYKELKHLILHVFSPDRNGAMPEILEFNMIMGAYMRMELLAKMKEYDLLLRDVKRMFGQMEQDTGTLWEYRIHKGSYDHGICAYVAAAIQNGLNRK